MAETNEPRALAAALSGPAFMPRARVFDVADRHVERWAPEATADRVRPLRNLGFADRLVSPLMETAQRSVSQLQRLFTPSPTAATDVDAGARPASGLGLGTSPPSQPDHTSWLFPRPSFQDELDWMAAARQPVRDPHQHNPLALPVSLHDYIAPALSPAATKVARAPFIRSLAGSPFEAALGPRLVMPVGLGGLVALVNQSLALGGAANQRAGFAGLGGFVGPGGWRAPTLAVPTLSALIPSMTLIATVAHQFGKPRRKATALAAAEATVPAAIQHVAWSDRWLARFSGAQNSSLDVLTPNRPVAAPELVLMAPRAEAAAAKIAKRVQQAATIRRYDDDEATPDDVLTEIVTSAAQNIVPSRTPRGRRLDAPLVRRDSVADVIAHTAPTAPDAGLSAQLASSPFAPAVRHVLPLAAAPVFDVRSLDGSNLSVAYLAGVLAPTSGLVIAGAALDARRTLATRDSLDWTPTLVATATAAATPTDLEASERRESQSSQPMTARSALLAPAVASTGARRTAADAFASSMTLPMITDSLGDSVGSLDTSGVQQRVSSYAAPGMIAGRAHAWSVAQERATSELALDFVPPELVLAARVYGLGPAEAGQAMRLAMAGPGQLAAMANAVDRTFVQVLEVEAERRQHARKTAERTVVALRPADVDDGPADAAPPVRSSAAIGVDRRQPRGAVMWPAAAVAALGLTAAPPDGEQAMSVAALELLAASAVAQLGTYAVLGRPQRRTELAQTTASDAAHDAPTASAEISGPPEVAADTFGWITTPPKQRAAFEAMYVALAKSAEERHDEGSWSPAADAARAVAFAGRGDGARTAAERAQAAWGVMPLLAMRPERAERDSGGRAAGGARGKSAGGATGIRADHAADSMPVVSRSGDLGPGSFELYAPPAPVQPRPGLAQLSARAGEAITSYVTPVVVSAAPTADAEARAAEAAAEIMRPGRSAGRVGGGETQIPTWFEAAARKSLSERSGSGEGLSLAELTLVNSAPAQQIAAADEAVSTSPPATAAPVAKPEFSPDQIKDLAGKVLTIVKRMIEAAKDRGGFTYG
jgi:hypothetical protein